MSKEHILSGVTILFLMTSTNEKESLMQKVEKNFRDWFQDFIKNFEILNCADFFMYKMGLVGIPVLCYYAFLEGHIVLDTGSQPVLQIHIHLEKCNL